MTDILKTFTYAFSWKKSFAFCFKFYWNLSQKVQLTISQHWFRLWLERIRQQAITWNNDDPVPCRLFVSPGISELTAVLCSLFLHIVQKTCYIMMPKFYQHNAFQDLFHTGLPTWNSDLMKKVYDIWFEYYMLCDHCVLAHASTASTYVPNFMTIWLMYFKLRKLENIFSKFG